MSVRRFGVLLRGLPASARTWAKEQGGWSITDHLLADVIDGLALARMTTWATVSTKPGQRPDFSKFRPRRRPTDEKPKPLGWGGFARALMGTG